MNTDSGEHMPPAVELGEDAPRETDPGTKCAQAGAGVQIDQPQPEADGPGGGGGPSQPLKLGGQLRFPLGQVDTLEADEADHHGEGDGVPFHVGAPQIYRGEDSEQGGEGQGDPDSGGGARVAYRRYPGQRHRGAAGHETES